MAHFILRGRPSHARLAAIIGLLVALVAATPAQASRHHRHHHRHAVRSGVRSAAPTPRATASLLRQMTGLSPSQVTRSAVCAAARRGRAGCAAEAVVTRAGHRRVRPFVDRRHSFTQVFPRIAHGIRPADDTADSAASPAGGTPAFLQQAYDLTYLSQTAGAGDTVAIVDANDDPTAESDLAIYRAAYGLPACSTANGCFRKVNQQGAPSPLPAVDPDWRVEESLDLDAVSALCPNCHIVLVEANDAGLTNLNLAVNEAAALGANQISNSWVSFSNLPLPGTYTFPGVSVLAATGDDGVNGPGWDAYPAAFPGVTAVGGTTLAASSTASPSVRGFGESAWGGAGSSCDTHEPKPGYQSDTGCSGRSSADVSADANPNTGLDIVSGGGWGLVGGTSLATPLVAAYEALTGIAGTPQWAYTDSPLLNDPITGSNGSCAAAISYICNAGAGYDGPTGVGSISGAIVNGAPGIAGPSFGSGAGNTYTQSVDGFDATVTGGIYPNGLATTYSLQYGTTTAYGQQTATASIGSGTAPVSASVTLSGLSPSTTYHYRLVAQNSAGTSYGYDSTLTTTTASPIVTVKPAVSGTALTGQTISTTDGTWSNAPTAYAYQWQIATSPTSGWSNIAGQTGSTYTLAAGDAGASFRVGVTATNGYGATTAYSGPLGPVASAGPVATVKPAASGNASVGSVISATTGSWSGAPTTYADQWQIATSPTSGWSAISGQTGPTYTLAVGDVGASFRVCVTATNALGSATACSAPVGPVSLALPVVSSKPAVGGNAWVGQTISATSGAWSPAGTYAYQWQIATSPTSGWSNVSGATSATYTLQSGDVGASFRVGVTVTNASGSATAYSGPLGAVGSGTPVATAIPTVAGSARVGQTLSATSGTWSPAGTYAYQWQIATSSTSGWSNVSGATASTYTLRAGDSGASFRVGVTATNGVGATRAYSGPVGPIQ